MPDPSRKPGHGYGTMSVSVSKPNNKDKRKAKRKAKKAAKNAPKAGGASIPASSPKFYKNGGSTGTRNTLLMNTKSCI